MKNGATVRVLRNQGEKYASEAHRLTTEAIQMQSPQIAGLAFVIWGADGSATTISLVNETSRIPPILVPEFVKGQLLSERIERWTIESIEEKKGR